MSLCHFYQVAMSLSEELSDHFSMLNLSTHILSEHLLIYDNFSLILHFCISSKDSNLWPHQIHLIKDAHHLDLRYLPLILYNIDNFH